MAGLLAFLGDQIAAPPALAQPAPEVYPAAPGAPFDAPAVARGEVGPTADLANTLGAQAAAGGSADGTPAEPPTVALDAAFLAAPLAQQLTLAAIALENARAAAAPGAVA